MAKLDYSAGKFNPKDWPRFLAAARKAVEKHDFDSGWIPTPADKIVKHKQGVLPKTVLVYASSSPNGNPMKSDTFTACDDQTVTITGPLAYCRVHVNV